MSLEAGWYDDESDAALLRYWDGAAWTPHTAARPADAAPNPLRAVAAGAASPVPPAASTTGMPQAQAPAPARPQVPSFDTAAAADDIDESTTVRPMGAPAPQPPVDAWAQFAPPAPSAPVAPPAASAPFAPPAASTPFAPPAPPAPSAQPTPAYPIAAPAAYPPPPAAPSEFPSYTLPAPPGYALQEQTTAPLPPAYNASAGPQFSYEPYRSTGRTFIATWLFAMLLGFWGADRFYLGKFGTAIAKLLTLGGLGIWVLVDLLLVLTGAQRDRDDRPLEGYDQHKRIAWMVTGGLVALSLLSSIVSGIASLFVR